MNSNWKEQQKLNINLLSKTRSSFFFSFFFLLHLVDPTCVFALGQTTALHQLCGKQKEDPKGLFCSSSAHYETGKEINQKEKKPKRPEKKLSDLLLLQPRPRSNPGSQILTPDL